MCKYQIPSSLAYPGMFLLGWNASVRLVLEAEIGSDTSQVDRGGVLGE